MVRFKSLWVLCLIGLSTQFPGRAANLLFITIDTLRADHLSCYGYAKNQTPHIDRWATEGVLFTQAYSEVPLTFPSHSTLFTGTLPFYHGVRDNGGFFLPERATTLAELLHETGFRTAAFIGAYVLASRFGLAQGFDLYDEIDSTQQEPVTERSIRRPAEEVGRHFLEWLEASGSHPFFAWVHFFDAHAPWPVSYDQEISRIDRVIGDIDSTLRRLDLMDDTHIFLVADHGESLGEHGESGHGFFVYDSTLRIPFLIRPASSFKPKSRKINQQVSLLDVAPTILQILGLPSPEHLQGQGLVRVMLGRRMNPRPLYAESYLPQIHFGWSRLRSLRLGRYKLIDAPRPEFYDLRVDPGEQRNIYSRRETLASRYHQQLRKFRKKYDRGDTSTSDSTQELSKEVAERLAALGYVAIAPDLNTEDGTGTVDPKDKIELFERFTEVVTELSAVPLWTSIKQPWPSTLTIFEKTALLRLEDPHLRGLYHLDGLAYERVRNWTKARDSYRLALQESPENKLARVNLANVYLRLRDLTSAEEVFKEVLQGDPDDYRSRSSYAMLEYRVHNDSSTAQRELRRVIQSAPDYPTAWLSLGVVLAEAENFLEAEKAFRRVIKLDGHHQRAYSYLEKILQAQGKTKEAEIVRRQARQALKTKQAGPP